MLVDCPGCARSYHVAGTDLGRGRTLVCPRCDARWFQEADATKGAAQDFDAAAISARAAARLDEAPAATHRRWPARPLLAAAAAAMACVALAAVVLDRVAIVRAVPRTAALYAAAGWPVNVVGLAFTRLTPERLASSDVKLHGALRNVAGRRVAVPRLAFEVRDGAGAPLVAWSESVPVATLAAGREYPFVSTPHRLPTESRTVLVHFE